MRYKSMMCLLPLIVVFLAACGTSPVPTSMPTPTAQTAAGLEVEIKGYSLLDITIPTGASIEWTSTHFAPHTITSGNPGAPDGVFSSATLKENDKFEFAFTAVGTFAYYCTIHPDSMRAIIEVADGEGYSTSGGSSEDGGEVAY